ncbi:MAG TPA: Rieske (2Fe-2S) protein [Mucilaginibacter sp.]|nr:Rieske (2Fe-2S) protein [Mucilaginibacter sp.]
MKWFRVSGIKDINEPFIVKSNVVSYPVCVVGYNGSIFAVSAVCPHQGFDLSSGWCENNKIICPLHGYAFDLKTGRGPNDYLKTFPVKIDGDEVFVGIKTVWDDIKGLFTK